MIDRLTFFVPGTPAPGGSKTATVIRRKGGEIVMKNGRPLTTTREDSKYGPAWKQQVSFFASQAVRDRPEFPIPRGVALMCRVLFVLPRLRGHYGTGRNEMVLKPDAPVYHIVKPDATKLMRALEDALTGIVWADDAQVAAPFPLAIYGDKPGARVMLSELGRKDVAALSAEQLDTADLFAQEVSNGR